ANNVAILRPPLANGNGWDPANSHRIDLSKVGIWPDWSSTLTSNVPDAKQTVVLDHFEQDLEDPAANREKLRAIEGLMRNQKRVVVVSTVDPLRFPVSGVADPSTASKPAVNEASVK